MHNPGIFSVVTISELKQYILAGLTWDSVRKAFSSWFPQNLRLRSLQQTWQALQLKTKKNKKEMERWDKRKICKIFFLSLQDAKHCNIKEAPWKVLVKKKNSDQVDCSFYQQWFECFRVLKFFILPSLQEQNKIIMIDKVTEIQILIGLSII